MTARIKYRVHLRDLGMVVVIAAMMTPPARPEAGAPRVLWEHRDGPFYSRQVLWRAAELTDTNLKSYYKQLSAELMGSRAWTVGVFIDADDAGRELHGKMVTEKGYDWWLALYNRFGRNLLPMAEIIESAENGVLRIRSTSGTSSEIVLAGENFLQVHLAPIEYQILKNILPLPTPEYRTHPRRRGKCLHLRPRLLFSDAGTSAPI